MKMAWAIGLAALVMASCSTEDFRYVPAENQASNYESRGQAIYSVPPSAPSGKVRVQSAGIADLKSKSDPNNATFPALHIRMSVSNQSNGTVWNVSPNNQHISLPNQTSILPIFVTSDQGGSPVWDVKPGELRVFDLYFRLPDSEKSAKDIPEFDFFWNVQVGTQPVVGTTAFNRLSDRYASAYFDPYGGPYDPYWGYPYAYGWGPRWGGGAYIHFRR